MPIIKKIQAKQSDYDYCYSLNKKLMKEMVEKVRWQRDENFQQNLFRNNKFDTKTYKLIEIDWVVWWVLNVIEYEDYIKLDEIQIDTNFQWLWVWKALINEVINLSKDQNKQLKLQVLKINSKAIWIYEKIWFEIKRETNTHYLMEYKFN